MAKLGFDLSGKRFGNLYVRSLHHKERRNNFWLCDCDCGNEVVVSGVMLRKEITRSCGCPVVEVDEKAILRQKVEVGRKVRFDPFLYNQGQLGDLLRGDEVTGTIVYVNYDHGWFSVEYGNLRTSFNFTDIDRTVTICG